MKKEDFYELAAQLEKECGDWEHSEGLSKKAKDELIAKVEAMELERFEKEKKNVKHFHIKKRYLLVLAAALVLAMGIGAVGDRAWISDGTDLERASEVTTKVDNEEKEDILLEEETMYQEISEKLGIAPLWLGYVPSGMVLESYTIVEDTGWACVNYLYQDKLVYVQMAKDHKEVSGNIQWDGAVRKLDNVPNEYGYEIEAYCVDEKQQKYNAKISYGNGYYEIFGYFSDKNEFFEILRGIFFKNV